MTKSLKKVKILKGFCCFSCYWTISVFNSVKKQKKQKNPLKNHYFQGILLFLLFLDTFGLLLAESCRHEAMHEKCTLPTIPLGPAGQGLYLKKNLTNKSHKYLPKRGCSREVHILFIPPPLKPSCKIDREVTNLL